MGASFSDSETIIDPAASHDARTLSLDLRSHGERCVAGKAHISLSQIKSSKGRTPFGFGRVQSFATTGVLRMCHILIIEDEPFIAMDLQQLLENEGATSFTFADSEEEAVASAMATRPDLITSDVKLAHGTGPSAIRIIHERLGMIPVIFVTGTPQDCDPCDPPGIVLSKPINAREVVKAFHTLHQ